MVAPVIPQIQINIRNYQPPNQQANAAAAGNQPVNAGAVGAQQDGIDGLRTVNFETRIIQDITALYPQNSLNQMNAFAYCLSQALIAPNEQFSDLVASALKSNFLALACLNPGQAKSIITQPHFANSRLEGIKDLIQRVEYYKSNVVLKFFHHLHGGLESERSASGKAFYAGTALCFGSAASLFVLQNENAQNIGIAGLAFGGLMALSCLGHAFKKVYQGEP